MDDVPLVFVVGLQKSGTTLLLRLLTMTSAFRNPVKFEGRDMWGDEPPFTPTAYPVGHIYQRDEGKFGHEIGAGDADPEIVDHVRRVLGAAGNATKGLVLKNPFNTGRVPWIRAMFPDAYIVAVVRRPLPNVFSLAKKHAPNPHVKQQAEEGWWGVKPAGWRELVQDDKLLQCAQQWDRVNAKLWRERDMIDRFVAYHDIAGSPTTVVGDLAKATVGTVPTMNFPPITVLDDEYKAGGLLQSANLVFRKTGSLDINLATRATEELAPLTTEEQDAIMAICGPTADLLGLNH